MLVREVSATSSRRFSPFAAVRQTFRDAADNQWFITTALRRDLKSQLGATAFARWWAFVMPLVPVSAFLALRLIFAPVDDRLIHPAIYVSVGATLWFLLSDLVLLPIRAVAKHRSVLSNSRLPLISVVFASGTNLLFDFLVRAVFTFGAILLIFGPVPVEALLIIPALIPCLMLCLAAGLLLMLLNFVYRDTEQVLTILMRYLIFVSFVIFPLDRISGFSVLEVANPFGLMVNTLRELLLFGGSQWIHSFGILVGTALVLFPLSLLLLYRVEPRIREYL